MADLNNRANPVGNEIEIGSVSIEGFSSQTTCSTFKHVGGGGCPSVYLGETLQYDVVVKRHLTLDASTWKKHISRLTCRATILPYEDAPDTSQARKTGSASTSVIIVEGNESESAANGLLCPVLATFVGRSSMSPANENDGSCKPYFRDDDTYVIPMSSHFQDVAVDCHFVQLHIFLCLYTVGVTRSDTSPELESKVLTESAVSGIKETEKETQPSKKVISVDIHELFGGDDDDVVQRNDSHVSLALSPVKVSSSYCFVQEKTVTAKIRIQGPPELRMRHSSAGQKQLILLAVSNKTQKHMVIKNIQMLSSSSPVHDLSLVNEEDGSARWEICHQVINLESPKRGHAFPVILNPWEELNLIYRLHLSSVPADSELSLRANVKWTHAGASNEITTIYKIPRIKVRCPPFVVTVKCDEDTELSKTFFVTYTISNQLHDFTSMRLYYNLDNMCRSLAEHGGTEEEINHVRHLKDSVVCHDPDTAISSCPRGSCVPVRVGFHIHKPGLYELSELMKVNLRYSLLDTQLSPVPDDRESHSASSDNSVSFQSSDDHLLASEELWRGRSGSTASLAMPAIFYSAEERRRSFASKSYSFGDLGPTVSADSDEAGNLRKNKFVKRSSAVPPPRPPPPRMLSQNEQELIKPSNFLKQPFYIYISDPLMM